MKKRFLFFIVITGLVLINACQKEHSFENGSGASEGSLQADGTGDCLPKTVAGTYVVGTPLDASNYIEVTVDVTKTGAYSIKTDTVNGMSFKAAGIFTSTGTFTVQLKGTGTPTATGIHNFIVTYGTSGCTIAITTSGSLAVFTLAGAPGSCTSATPAGMYVQGVILDATNTVNISVDVTQVGAYNISTALSNGMTFAATGVFTATGVQAVVLSGTGTPANAGATNFPLTAGSSSCSFSLTVQPPGGTAVYTVNCGTATVNGTYTVNTALVGANNTVTLPVDVTTIGSYSVTGTAGGMTFTGSGTFTATGTQNITLTGSGTPTTAGANTVTLSGGTASCNITVTVAGPSPATFTVNCASATVNGTYTANVALTAANTIVLPVNVTAIGTYSITATLNGMSFSASGTFGSTGAQNVTLTGTGTPNTQGANAVPVTGGTGTCNVTVNVAPASGGAATYTVNCGSAVQNGVYVAGQALTSANTISIDVNVTAAGTYTITTTATNGMTFSASGTFTTTGMQTVTLTGTGTPTSGGIFNLPVASGSTPCTVSLGVYYGLWSFKVGTTTYSGGVDTTNFDPNIVSPFLLFFLVGGNAAGDVFEIDLVDLNSSVAANEQYVCNSFTGTANAAGVYFDGASGTTYYADPSLPTNTMVVKVTSHNTATKTMVGTFSGKAVLNSDSGGTTLVDITNGQFSVVYP